ncbi:MAG: hypothetical protein K2G22_04285, partial [Eubacterium sp.]|nr:hypothetical protein [Eubacterium sp.]
ILEYINMVMVPEFNDTLTSEDLDYNNCVRIYRGRDLLIDDSINENNIIEAVAKLDYDYKIFFEYENAYPQVIMSKVNKVKEDTEKKYTAEELAEHDKHIGEVALCGISIGETKDMHQCYKDDIERFLKHSKDTYSKVHIIYDLPGDLGAAAMLITENSEIRFKVLGGVIDNKEIDHNNPSDTLYTFEELKTIVANSEPVTPGYIGGLGTNTTQPSNNNTIIIIAACAGAVIIIAAAVTVTCLKKKKAKSDAELNE